MRIYYDNIIYSLQKMGGISRYWHELTTRFLADETSDISFIEHKKICDNRLRSSLNIPLHKIIYEHSLPISISRYMPVSTRLCCPCVFHSSYYRDITGSGAAKIVTVHDFTYEYFSSGLKKLVHTSQKHRAINRADGIICISENTRRDLMKFCPDIPEEKVTVIHNGVSADIGPSPLSRDEILGRHGLKEDRYIIFIGERSGYKNFTAAAKAAGLSGCFLLIIGGRELTADETEILNSCLKGRYLRLGFIDNQVLNELYSIALCLVYPSLYEGFGIPVTEAMKCGCPVVASTASSIPEAAGDAGLLTDDLSPESLAGIITSLDNKAFRSEIVIKGLAHSKKFSWNKCFAETKTFYKKIISSK